MKSEHHIYMLEKAAAALEPLNERLVYTGGAIVPVYLDTYTSEFRPTQDVDCIIEVAGRVAYNTLESEIRSLGLKNDIHSGVICRWVVEDILVDVMPTDEKILGFTNSWYKKAIKNGVSFALPSGKEIYIFTYEYLLCAKIEAFWSRGVGDILVSKDMEDVVMLLAFSTKVKNILNADSEILTYLSREFKKVLEIENYTNEISGYFLPDPKSQGKVIEVTDLMNRIIILGNQ